MVWSIIYSFPMHACMHLLSVTVTAVELSEDIELISKAEVSEHFLLDS